MSTQSAAKPVTGAPLPRFAQALFDPKKLEKYALDYSHPDGRHKARVFEDVLGYTLRNAGELRRVIMEGLADSPVIEVRDGYQDATWICVVDMTITGPSGRTALVRTEWETTVAPHRPRLTTLFVKRSR